MIENLKLETKEAIKAGNTKVLKEVLENELATLMEKLIFIPEPQVKILQGQCRSLKSIIKLLP